MPLVASSPTAQTYLLAREVITYVYRLVPVYYLYYVISALVCAGSIWILVPTPRRAATTPHTSNLGVPQHGVDGYQHRAVTTCR